MFPPLAGTGGTGLGLAISKRLSGMMGGTTGLESELGRGSTFWFTVNAREVQAPPSAVMKKSIAPGSKRGGRVLVAEDNAINQKVAMRLLSHLGYSADFVNDGAEALERIQAGEYDLVLMDCQMPVMDGFEADARHSAASRQNRQNSHHRGYCQCSCGRA